MYGAAAGAIGDIVGGLASSGMAFASANRQMKFQEKMYKHRYQWTVQDMLKAGINPIYAAQMGLGGGSVPPGAKADVPDFSSAGSKAMAALRSMTEIGALRAQSERDRAHTQLYKQSAWTEISRAQMYTRAAELANVEKILKGFLIPMASAQAEADRGAFGQRSIKFNRFLQQLSDFTGIISNAAGIVKPRGGGITINK